MRVCVCVCIPALTTTPASQGDGPHDGRIPHDALLEADLLLEGELGLLLLLPPAGLGLLDGLLASRLGLSVLVLGAAEPEVDPL